MNAESFSKRDILRQGNIDIAQLTYRSVNLSYLAKGGIVAPEHYDQPRIGFICNFHGRIRQQPPFDSRRIWEPSRNTGY